MACTYPEPSFNLFPTQITGPNSGSGVSHSLGFAVGVQGSWLTATKDLTQPRPCSTLDAHFPLPMETCDKRHQYDPGNRLPSGSIARSPKLIKGHCILCLTSGLLLFQIIASLVIALTVASGISNTLFLSKFHQQTCSSLTL